MHLYLSQQKSIQHVFLRIKVSFWLDQRQSSENQHFVTPPGGSDIPSHVNDNWQPRPQHNHIVRHQGGTFSLAQPNQRTAIILLAICRVASAAIGGTMPYDFMNLRLSNSWSFWSTNHILTGDTRLHLHVCKPNDACGSDSLVLFTVSIWSIIGEANEFPDLQILLGVLFYYHINNILSHKSFILDNKQIQIQFTFCH